MADLWPKQMLSHAWGSGVHGECPAASMKHTSVSLPGNMSSDRALRRWDGMVVSTPAIREGNTGASFSVAP